MTPETPEKKGKQWAFIGIGAELIGLIVAAVFIGQALESRYPSKGLIPSGLIIFALAAWLTHIVLMLKAREK